MSDRISLPIAVVFSAITTSTCARQSNGLKTEKNFAKNVRDGAKARRLWVRRVSESRRLRPDVCGRWKRSSCTYLYIRPNTHLPPYSYPRERLRRGTTDNSGDMCAARIRPRSGGGLPMEIFPLEMYTFYAYAVVWNIKRHHIHIQYHCTSPAIYFSYIIYVMYTYAYMYVCIYIQSDLLDRHFSRNVLTLFKIIVPKRLVVTGRTILFSTLQNRRHSQKVVNIEINFFSLYFTNIMGF